MRVEVIHALGAAEALLKLNAKELEEASATCMRPCLVQLQKVTARELREHAETLRKHRESEGKAK